MSHLTDQQYWMDSYGAAQFVKYSLDNEHFRLLFRHVDGSRIGRVMEIGSYPGPFLAALGERGYELNGIDFHPGNASDLPAWLRSQGFRVGTFSSGDFLSHAGGSSYDLVYSLGFVEHFRNFDEVVAKHARLVREGGYVFITAPNFRGVVQRWLHRALDRRNLEKHHLPAMSPDSWAKVLREEGFEVLFAGYFGGIGFWVDPAGSAPSSIRLVLARLIARVFWNLRKLYKGDSAHFSQHCAVIAAKPARP